jgi:hypothetical protein
VSTAVIIVSGHKNVHYSNQTLPRSEFLATAERRIRRIWSVDLLHLQCVGRGGQPMKEGRHGKVQGSARCNNEML